MLRRIWISICVLLSFVSAALALSPPEIAVLFNRGIKPAYYANLLTGTLPSSLTFARAGQATQYDATGKLTYAPNNLLLNSATLSTQSITTVASNYIISMYGTGSITLSGTATGTITGTGAANQVYLKVTATAGTLTLTVSGSVTSAVAAQVTYETMPRAGDQVITTSAAYYGPRFDYNPSTLAPVGLLIEGSATNLFLNSSAGGSNLATQNVTTTAQAYTISFYGTGSIVLSGTATATITGTGAYPARTTYTFTPTAGTLTATVLGTVQYANCEAFAFATSFIPTAATVVTRAADTALLTGVPLSVLQGAQASYVEEATLYSQGTSEVFLGGSAGMAMIYTYANNLAVSYDASSSTISATTGSGGWLTTARAALSFSNSGRSLVMNGGTVATTASPFVSSRATLGIAGYAVGGSLPLFGWVRSFAVYNSRLPDSVLKSESLVGAPY
jgi:hypothetical protein